MTVFVTGGTGYMGRRVIPRLLERGHAVRALARPGSEHKVPPGAAIVQGNALDAATFAAAVPPAETFLQLVGTPNPGPGKAQQFRDVDLASVRASVAAARGAGVRHFVYVSVAQPAPIMADYLAVRAEAEALIKSAGFAATFLRPWYVIGPGHRWPLALVPFYWLAERLPSTRESAVRLGLVTIAQMVDALVRVVDQPPDGVRIVDVAAIRRG